MQINLSKRLSLILFTGYGTILLLMAITLSITIQSTNSVKKHSQSVLKTEIPEMLHLMNLDRQLNRSVNHLNEYLISGEKTDQWRFYASMNELQNRINEQFSIVHPNLQAADAFKDLVQQYQKKADYVVELREDDEKNYLGIAQASEQLNPFHQQFISTLDNIIASRFSEAEEGNHSALEQLIKTRNSWNNMIMSLRVYFTTRSAKDFDRIFLYREQNAIDMKALLKIRKSLGFDELFVDELADIYKTYMANLPKVLETYQTDKWRMDTYVIRTEIYPITNQLRKVLESLVANKKQVTQQQSVKLSDELDSLTDMSKITFAISLLVGLIAILIVVGNIRRIVNELDKSREDSIKRSEMLQKSSLELADSLEELKSTQSQLVEHEKMAALGNLVAGMAHEINTPIGIGVTASSHITDITHLLEKKFDAGTIKKSDFVKYIEDTKESNVIMLTNLRRAADLIRSFKQIAVDQSSEELRQFEIGAYLQEVYNSLIPNFKKTLITVDIACPIAIFMESYPGALAQVLTNLMMNSLIHGFDEGDNGVINITATQNEKNSVTIIYKDNGKGMNQKTLSQIFDPFFTTKRSKGGSGLGMHLLYNLVSQKLKGSVTVDSSPGKGVSFVISLPLKIPKQEK